jgi:S-DNA-T family DNA segregation ATPase FtsK/SpoIIIE
VPAESDFVFYVIGAVLPGKKKIAAGLILIVIAIFIGAALQSYDRNDSFSMDVENKCGPVGALIASGLRWIFGSLFSWVVPLALLYAGAVTISGRGLSERRRPIVMAGLLTLILCAFAAWFDAPERAGRLGTATYSVLEMLTGRTGSVLILSAALLVTLVTIFFGKIRAAFERSGGLRIPRLALPFLRRASRETASRGRSSRKRAAAAARDLPEIEASEPVVDEEPVHIDIPERRPPAPKPKKASESAYTAPRPAGAEATPADDAPLPDLSLLDDYDESAISFSRDDLIARSEMIEEKLLDYGLKGKVQKVLPGPVVTTFEFVPAAGVRVSQIANRADDLSLALAARSLRIQAPIPGKSAVGIEVPNPEPKLVLLKEMMEHFPESAEGLTVTLGKTVTGEPYFADIADMPHLLIAGATGSGKSVCINSIICSLLFTHTPATCRFILVDPKRLELITYNDIPHLLHPVITEARPTLKVLSWLTIEMDRRYRLLAQFGVKNIKSFNRKVASEELRHPETDEVLIRLPYYVTVIDELADLMVSLGNEIYPPITRLSQMARAVGIHLVFATQRPSVDVVTGLIKANFPTRIAFQVTSKTDSRTILDVNGAETLLGNGDMLYLPKNLPSPVRLQGAYISEREAENVADYWKDFGRPKAEIDLSEAAASGGTEDADVDDDLYEQARELVIIHQQGSISLIQRRLRVGYARAARLIDMLEQSGVVGPFEGSKAREVLISREEYEQSR